MPDAILRALELDPRQGARELAAQIRDRRRRNRAEGQRLRYLSRFERALWDSGVGWVGGVDEVGMAPLAGPVVAACVILPQGYRLCGLDDSKKITDPGRRTQLARHIRSEALCWAVGAAGVEEIDTLNIYHAGLLAMRRAVDAMSLAPQILLVDGRKLPSCSIAQRRIVHGDALSASIAAASVVAKTIRDAWMSELDRQYPGYGFNANKGYPTPDHCAALHRLGPCAMHRRSFARVREAWVQPQAALAQEAACR